MTETLVEKLRSYSMVPIVLEAADRIEALENLQEHTKLDLDNIWKAYREILGELVTIKEVLHGHEDESTLEAATNAERLWTQAVKVSEQRYERICKLLDEIKHLKDGEIMNSQVMNNHEANKTALLEDALELVQSLTIQKNEALKDASKALQTAVDSVKFAGNMMNQNAILRRELEELRKELPLPSDTKAEILKTIVELWKKAPDLRFGQLIDAFSGTCNHDGACGKLFYAKDQDILDSLTKGLTRKSDGNK